MKIETSRPPSRCEVSVCLQRSKLTMGSRSGILIFRVGDGVLLVLWELLWLSVCDSELLVWWLKASRVQGGLQVTGQQRGDVVQEDGFPRVHP